MEQDYRRAVAEQIPLKMETYDEVMNRWYQVSAYPAPDGLSVYFEDINDRRDFERYKDEQLQRERHISEVLQKTVIPEDVPTEMPGCRVFIKYQPALREAEVGGDFYDLFELDNGKVAIVIGDVAGKGLAAAVRVTAARYAIRSYARLFESPATVLCQANDALETHEEETGMLTACLTIVDLCSGELVSSSAGHEPIAVVGRDGHCFELEGPGVPLGILRNMTYGESRHVLQPGDKLVMMTDGIPEARSSDKDMLGKEAVMEYLRGHALESPSELAEGLVRVAVEHAGGHLQDDAALVVFEWIGQRANCQS